LLPLPVHAAAWACSLCALLAADSWPSFLPRPVRHSSRCAPSSRDPAGRSSRGQDGAGGREGRETKVYVERSIDGEQKHKKAITSQQDRASKPKKKRKKAACHTPRRCKIEGRLPQRPRAQQACRVNKGGPHIAEEIGDKRGIRRRGKSCRIRRGRNDGNRAPSWPRQHMKRCVLGIAVLRIPNTRSNSSKKGPKRSPPTTSSL
jgi:hypothetical protein